VLLAFVLAFIGGHRDRTAAQAPPAKIPIILDTDIGTDIDDAWALAYAINSPVFELVGVTISDADTASRAKLACKLLHRAGRTDVPVAVGRATPAVPPDRYDFQFTWAEDFTAYRPIATPAADFIAEQARKRPGQLTLVAVGPLQNLGDLFRKHPDVAKLFKRVVLMSGSIGNNRWGPGPIPEWNVQLAIPEAQRVYAAGLPLTTVPLDSTSYVVLQDDERKALVARKTPVARAVEALYRLWIDEPSERMTLHDQLALAEAQHPGRFFGRCESMPIRVDDKGYTRVDRAGGSPTAVCLEPKRDEFMKHFLAQVGR
jgi:inosine-uridine nucleoside N-ribohydrolase